MHRAGPAAFEVALVPGFMEPVSALFFMLLVRLGRWFYFIVVHSVGGPLL